MIKSLYSGVTGMKSFQTKMDVVANNIANVNTTAFKSGRVNFQDMLSQTLSNEQGPTAVSGGVNPQQVGLGVKVGAIDTIMTDGSLQSTNRELDFAIEGNGFFAVSEDNGLTVSYTRDGTFYKDYQGNLVTGSGFKVLGYATGTDATGTNASIPFDVTDPTAKFTADANAKIAPLNIPETIDVATPVLDAGGNPVLDADGNPQTVNVPFELQSFTVDRTGMIKGVYSDGKTATKTYILGQVSLVNFSNTAGLEKIGSNNYAATDNSGAPTQGIAGNPGYGYIRQSSLEMSNVDLATEFTEMIVTSRAYQANSRTISTSDEMLQELINLKR